MSNVKFKVFYDNSKSKLFKDLLKEHLKKTSTNDLNISSIGTAIEGNIVEEKDYDILGKYIHTIFVQNIIDNVGVDELVNDNTPYHKMTIEESFDLILDMFQDFYAENKYNKNLKYIQSCIEDFENLNNEQDEFLWNIFQTVSLELTYQISLDKNKKRFFGIKTGFFG